MSSAMQNDILGELRDIKNILLRLEQGLNKR